MGATRCTAVNAGSGAMLPHTHSISPPPPPLQTLMDVLAGRKTGGVITGDIRVNGALCGAVGGLLAACAASGSR